MLSQLARTILGAETTGDRSEAVMALGSGSPPSNEQILNASKKAYSQYQPAVDALTLALVNLINTGSQLSTITTLDGINWTSPGIKAEVAEPIFACPDVKGATHAARGHPDLNSLSVGVFSKDLPGGGVGMVGFDRDLAGSTTSGLKLTLDIFRQIVSTDFRLESPIGGVAGSHRRASRQRHRLLHQRRGARCFGESQDAVVRGARPVRLRGQHGSNGPGFKWGICGCDGYMAVTEARLPAASAGLLNTHFKGATQCGEMFSKT